MSRLFVRKSIDALKPEAALGRRARPETTSLSALSLTLLGVGGVIGSGIFIMTGQEAAGTPDPPS